VTLGTVREGCRSGPPETGVGRARFLPGFGGDAALTQMIAAWPAAPFQFARSPAGRSGAWPVGERAYDAVSGVPRARPPGTPRFRSALAASRFDAPVCPRLRNREPLRSRIRFFFSTRLWPADAAAGAPASPRGVNPATLSPPDRILSLFRRVREFWRGERKQITVLFCDKLFDSLAVPPNDLSEP